MIIEHDTVTNEYRIACDHCGRFWVYGASEIILEPFPHVVCPACGEWIFIPDRYIFI